MLSNNAVVVYFSRIGENYSVGEIEVGNTAKVAQVIASRIGAPTVEIVPVAVSYTHLTLPTSDLV